MARVVVDPISRIEGHLRIEAEIEDNRIASAYSSCTMWRGLEHILKGRDPRDCWAFAQRICGVCTTVHAYASIRAVENALGIPVPDLAQAFRNLMIATQNAHDHVMHFYHLHALDWVNVPNALKADPRKTADLAQSISPWPNSSSNYFKEVQEKLKKFVASGQLGIFANGYWDHPGYKLPAEADLLATAHYLEALDWQRNVIQIITLLGGKNPHPNFVVGGVPLSVNLASPNVVNAEVLAQIKTHIDSIRTFIEQVYIPDLLAIAGFYTDWAQWGAGVGNLMTYGELPGKQLSDLDALYLPRGVILNHDLSHLETVDTLDVEQVTESIAHSWYKYREGNDKALHPFNGETTAQYTGPKPPYDHLHVEEKYSWLKAPRWRGHAMEVGPLARMTVAYVKGHRSVKDKVDQVLHKLKAKPTILFSTLGRTAARGVEAWVMSDYLADAYERVVSLIRAGETSTFNGTHWDPATWPRQARGVGTMEAPRGSLGHWITIEDGVVGDYQIVVPSTWNGGPRDQTGQPGPYEAALMGTPVHKADQPLEILRTVHSFDPCMACAAHVYDTHGHELARVRVQ